MQMSWDRLEERNDEIKTKQSQGRAEVPFSLQHLVRAPRQREPLNHAAAAPAVTMATASLPRPTAPPQGHTTPQEDPPSHDPHWLHMLALREVTNHQLHLLRKGGETPHAISLALHMKARLMA